MSGIRDSATSSLPGARNRPLGFVLRPRPNRRNAATRAAVVERVTCEFREVPGLCLTLAQAEHLFNLPEPVCGRILAELIDAGALQKLDQFYGAFRSEFVGRYFAVRRDRETR